MITPILLAGGSGTRLWPLSRETYPKQFSKFISDKSLFQNTAERLNSSEIMAFNAPIIITNNDYRFIVTEQLQSIGIDPGTVIIEPKAKNTAPAILAASLFCFSQDPDAVLLVAPSDHYIDKLQPFYEVISRGITDIKNGKIVTFGISPDRLETGYGYIKTSNPSSLGSCEVTEFVEKPDSEAAKKMIASGDYLWNSGMFLFRAADLIEEYSKLQSNLVKHVKKALNNSKIDLGFLRLDQAAWSNCDNISIDYAIMEKTSRLVAHPLCVGWSDLGGWDAIWERMEKDEYGVALSENAHSHLCENTLLRSENEMQQIVGIGLTDIIAVAMPDAVLVADKNALQDIKQVVNTMRLHDIAQATEFPKEHRPWGWFESLALQSRFQVKRIMVNPGSALSLQSHHHRSEHWIVVQGTALVTINDEETLITEGQSVYIPLGAIHRLANPGIVPMILIEVQTGVYLGEDDIIRYEDIYSREIDGSNNK